MFPPFPEPTIFKESRAAVFLTYLEYFRSALLKKIEGLSEPQLRQTIVPSGWAPIELAKHLTCVEMRWLVWGFEGQEVPDPWLDSRDGRWFVAPDETIDEVTSGLQAQAEITSAIVLSHDLQDKGQPGPRWEGADPPTLERVLFHLLQEYARHVGQLDIVRELTDGEVGE